MGDGGINTFSLARPPCDKSLPRRGEMEGKKLGGCKEVSSVHLTPHESNTTNHLYQGFTQRRFGKEQEFVTRTQEDQKTRLYAGNGDINIMTEKMQSG